MTDPQFANFLQAHFGNFPAVASWLNKFPRQSQRDFDVTQKQVMDAWRKTLRDVSLEDAIAASDALASGDETFSEKAGFDHHPRDIRRICRTASGGRSAETKSAGYIRRFEGEPTFRCPKCKDEGFRFAIHPQSVNAARSIIAKPDGSRHVRLHHPTRNPDGNEPLYSCVLACDCEAGWRRRALTRPWRSTDAEWQLGYDENYDAALAAAEGVRAAETESRTFNPDEWTYDTPDEF